MSEYPMPSYHFQVEWGEESIHVSEVSGLNIEVQVIEYREGGSPEYSPIKIPGIRKYDNITFKRGIIPNDNQFFAWLNSITHNQRNRRNLIISLLNENHDPVMTWKVKNAFPVKLQGPVLKATGNEIAIETLEVAHEGLTIETD